MGNDETIDRWWQVSSSKGELQTAVSCYLSSATARCLASIKLIHVCVISSAKPVALVIFADKYYCCTIVPPSDLILVLPGWNFGPLARLFSILLWGGWWPMASQEAMNSCYYWEQPSMPVRWNSRGPCHQGQQVVARFCGWFEMVPFGSYECCDWRPWDLGLASCGCELGT